MRFDTITTRRVLTIGFAMVMGAVIMPAGLSADTRGASDKLPDLRMASMYDFHIQTYNGRRRLRFDTTIVNVGKGPFEVLGNRDCSSLTTCPRMDVRQVIYRTDGTKRYRTALGVMKYTGDGHNHWHVQRIETYEIFRRSPGSSVKRGAKVGFCFFDNVAYRLSLPGAPNNRVYHESGCGVSSSTSTRVGLSVGWGDLYPWDFAYQYIDITGLTPGNYRVCATTDLANRYLETNNGNNMVWQDVTLYSNGSVGVGGKGWTACRTGIGSSKDGEAPSDAGYPEQQVVHGDAPGSVVCPAVDDSLLRGRAGEAAGPCREIPAADGRPATPSAGAVGETSSTRHPLPAALAPNRRQSAAREAAFICRI